MMDASRGLIRWRVYSCTVAGNSKYMPSGGSFPIKNTQNDSAHSADFHLNYDK
jgi:hypothetical protein